LADPLELTALQKDRDTFKQQTWSAEPLIGGVAHSGDAQPVLNPANPDDVVGQVTQASPAHIEDALAKATIGIELWRSSKVEDRAACLLRIADLYEDNSVELMALAAREAGKTLNDCVGELREAVDFCRYYAAETKMADQQRQGRGVFLCISPWNFPLAIFTGQIVAALVSGNAVIAKPAEQTPLIATRAIQLMHQAGIPGDVLHLLPGDGPSVGGVLAADPRISGVCFTGSTDTARIINATMASKGNPKAPLIAETGGLNAMIVDSSALPEQAVRDIVTAAFQSAGQRCSALRVLFVQSDIAEGLLSLLEGAMDELCIGDPWDLKTDVGPVIDEEARDVIEAHCQKMEMQGRLIRKIKHPESAGFFVNPSAYLIDSIADLEHEIFGPVLHVVTFEAEGIDDLVESINARGYGLTMGIHTRVDKRVQDICDKARVGNIYVNRNQIGAVVGVQPFGGEGLSGTGPKAGGPHYLTRFSKVADRRVEDDGALPSSSNECGELSRIAPVALSAQRHWDQVADRAAIIKTAAEACSVPVRDAILEILSGVSEFSAHAIDLPGPTGESNRLTLHGRGVFVCLGGVTQAALALLLGNAAIVPKDVEAELFCAFLPAGLFGIVDDITLKDIEIAPDLAGVVFAGNAENLRAIRSALAARSGAILPLIDDLSDWRQMLIERALCIDTTASGGNAALLASAGLAD